MVSFTGIFLRKELGIFATDNQLHFIGTFPIKYEKEFHGKVFKDNEIAFVYTYEESIDIDKLVIQKEELDSVAWFKLNEVYEACLPPRDKRFCVPMKGLEIIKKYTEEGNNAKL